MDVNKDSVPESKKSFVDLPFQSSPDMVDSENISLFDLHEDMQTVDSIPVGELNKKVKREGDEWLEQKGKHEGNERLDS